MGTLINATEAKKHSEIFEENYSANKSGRVKEAIKVALEIIDRNVKSRANRGQRNISYIIDEECREDLASILIKHGYTVDCRFLGGDNVKFIISW